MVKPRFKITKPMVIAVFIACVLWFAGPGILTVHAFTVEELITQIETLQQQIAALQNQLNELQKKEIAKVSEEEKEREVVTQTAYIFTRNLRYGDTNTNIRDLQICLKSDPTIYPEALVTGYFGSLTKTVVIRFQEKYADEILKPLGLFKGTGFVGESTRAKLNTICGVFSKLESTVPKKKPIVPEVKTKLKPETKSETKSELKPKADNTAPIILDIAVSDLTATGAKITLQTNEITKATLVNWEEYLPFFTAKLSGGWGTSHWIQLTNLQPNTTYFLDIVVVQDEAGNKTITERKNFKTLDSPKPVEIPKPVIPEFEPIEIPNICVNCLGTDTSCGCLNCTDCNKLDGWVNVGKPYHSDLGPGGFYMNQKQEYRNYHCSGNFCEYTVTGTQTDREWIKDSFPPLYPGMGLPKNFGEIQPFDPGVRQDPGPIIPLK